MFNDANVDNRLREPVRGRVIVATTSTVVELLDHSLKHSYPLYSVDAIPAGCMLVFCVEVDGFLTFDPNSEVRILPETQLFDKLYYDPTAFRLVRTADPYPAYINHVSAWFSTPEKYQAYRDNGYVGDWDQLIITVVVDAAGTHRDYKFFCKPFNRDDNYDFAKTYNSPDGTLFRGEKGYPGLTFDPTV